MNTTAAAIQANVTADTIRTWCRRGAVAAIKQAGRWVIDAASLAARIAIGKLKTRKVTVTLDLNATYTADLPGYDGPVTITPTIKRRERNGQSLTKISGIVPLFADKLDAIPALGDRLHAVTVLKSATIVICDTPDTDWDNDPQARESGQLRTTYRGTVPGITVDDVLDLAERIRAAI